MTRELQRRVRSLEGDVSYAGIGDVLDAISREEAGEVVDWSAIRLNPALVKALEAMEDAHA